MSLWQRDIRLSSAEAPLRVCPAGSPAYHTAYSLSSGFRGIYAHTPKFMKSYNNSKRGLEPSRATRQPQIARKTSARLFGLLRSAPIPRRTTEKRNSIFPASFVEFWGRFFQCPFFRTCAYVNDDWLFHSFISPED